MLILFPVVYLPAQGYIDKVVIDAGHGGKDPGAVGTKYREKDIVLKIALKVGEYIEDNFDEVEVIYTRKTDKFVELYKRSEIANENNADLFISIHCNAVNSSSPYGSETYAMGLHKNEANLEVAKQENASVLLEDNYKKQYDGFDPNSPEAHIIFSLYQNTYLEQSLKLASKVQYQFRERVKRHDRGVKQAGFLVLWRTTMPAILIEAGFLSNPTEQEFLGSEKGQAYIASAIFRAFRDYKHEMEGDLEEKPDEPVISKKDTSSEKTVEKVQDDVFFAVQFTTSSRKKEVDDPIFSNVKNVKRYYHKGLYKYYVGNERSLNAAVILQHKMQKKGYDDAFVIAFVNGTRVTVSKASEIIAH
jgi:N-acetylmuramoyl-L-alanine amidase